uniref:Elongation factor 1-beta n=1 Tax=Myotis myotis TaxID=51298 RepID=A0A7J7WGE3_MYOMY|nr:eukaryotic translation elongation factor 1 beta 2 [Myotis myotis]
MGFGDLRSPSGLQVLNNYLADKSYIEGYVPSQADVAVFEAVSGPPPADLCHALRWYNHIKSYEKEKASLPGVKKALGKYGPANVEDTTGSGAADSKDDDDDIDLFGSDDEEESEEAKRLREERLAQYESKKAKSVVRGAFNAVISYLQGGGVCGKFPRLQLHRAPGSWGSPLELELMEKWEGGSFGVYFAPLVMGLGIYLV